MESQENQTVVPRDCVVAFRIQVLPSVLNMTGTWTVETKGLTHELQRHEGTPKTSPGEK